MIWIKNKLMILLIKILNKNKEINLINLKKLMSEVY